MERSERSSTGKAAGSPAAAERGAPGHATSTADAGSAPPIDPDDEGKDDELEARDDENDDDELEGVRAEPWLPDAGLMRAFGLELAELRPRADAGEPDLTDEHVRPAPAEPRAEAEARVSCDEGRLPWW
jgi:hypothetical protein